MNERGRSRGGAAVFSPIKRLLIIAILIVMIFFLLKVKGIINDKNAEYARVVSEIETIEDEIVVEDNKAAEFKKSNKKDISDDEIESLAREELGLIKRDEIIIKPN